MGEGLAEGGDHLGVAFFGVVEDDDGTGTRLVEDVVGDFWGGPVLYKVSGDDVPHDDLVGLADLGEGCEVRFAVGGAEKLDGGLDSGLEGLVGEVDVLEVGGAVGFPAVEVVEGVVAEGVSGGVGGLDDVGVARDVFADTKEGCLGLVVGEEGEDFQGDVWMGAVVKGEVDALLVAGHVPQELG